MSGIIRYRRSISIENSTIGNTQYGDIRTAVNAVSVDDLGRQTLSGTMDPGDKVVLWSWATHGRWSLFDLFFESSGALQLRGLVDTRTSSTNHTPTGTINRWEPMPNKSCVCALSLDTDETRVKTTAADDYGSDGSGLPSAFSESGMSDVYYYKIAAYLPTTATESVRWVAYMVMESDT